MQMMESQNNSQMQTLKGGGHHRLLPTWKTYVNLTIHAIQLTKKESDYSQNELCQLAYNKINSLEAEYIIFTNVSISGKQDNCALLYFKHCRTISLITVHPLVDTAHNIGRGIFI